MTFHCPYTLTSLSVETFPVNALPKGPILIPLLECSSTYFIGTTFQVFGIVPIEATLLSFIGTSLFNPFVTASLMTDERYAVKS